jgi:vitamin B12/bleomycin/antimicrobial peptide transport system ATP-binding/permease protein
LDDRPHRNEPQQAVEDVALVQEEGAKGQLQFWDSFSEAEREEYRRAYLLRRFWRSAAGFWGRYGARGAWLLAGGLVVLIVMQVSAQYALNLWNRHIFDAIEKRDAATVGTMAGLFVPLAITIVCIGVTLVYARMSTQRRWRRWMTSLVLDGWLDRGRYYQLNLVSGHHENPEYRLAEDMRVATDAPVDFLVGVASAFLSASTFVVVLWTIGGAISFSLGGTDITIPGFLVIAALIYAIVASASMVWIGRRFVAVSEEKNQSEADFRYVLTRVRENGESIALLGGADEERAGIDRSLGNVIRRWRDVCIQHMRTTSVSLSTAVIAPVIPLLLCSPKFLAGEMSLGQVMQAASAFTLVQAAFNWLVDNYPRLADWTASARRAAALLVALDALQRAEQGDGMMRIDHGETDGAALELCDLSVTLDDGTAVVDETRVDILPGERVLVVGESGTGKSTLVRAIAGLWPWGQGSIRMQAGSKLFLLPQRPYIPVGSLRRAITYPAPAEEWNEKDIAAALKKVGLEHLVDKITEEGPWDHTLSGGEKQRVAIARVLLHRPDVIVFDESTSALDPGSQDEMMEIVSKELPDSTIISVGHRPELEKFHSRKLVLERRRGGAKLVSDILLEPRNERLLQRWMRRRQRRERREKRQQARKAA